MARAFVAGKIFIFYPGTNDAQESEMALFGKHERTGRPIGDETFIERLERLLDRRLKPRKPGPKPRAK